MIGYLPQWSLTRRKIFTNCARRFALQYFNMDKAKMVRRKSTRFIAHHDLMIKCTRIVFFELLSDLHRGVVWSDKLIISKMRFQINIHTSTKANTKLSLKKKNLLIRNGFLRLKKLMKQEIPRKILDKSIKEWSFYERIKSTKFGHLDVYCSPDIVYRENSVWHLVRLNFQSEHKQPFLDLELCSMLLWSQGNQYLPNLADKFVIHGLSFVKGKWFYRKIRPSQKLLQETKQLLEKDVHNFNLLFEKLYRNGDYDALPLAKYSLYCKRCPYKVNCPINLE